jgi:hypothetical protein
MKQLAAMLLVASLLFTGSFGARAAEDQTANQSADASHWQRPPTFDDLKMPDGRLLSPAELSSCKRNLYLIESLRPRDQDLCPEGDHCAWATVDLDTMTIVGGFGAGKVRPGQQSADASHWQRPPTFDDLKMPDGRLLSPAWLDMCKHSASSGARTCPDGSPHRCATARVNFRTMKIVSIPSEKPEAYGQTVTLKGNVTH